MLTIREVKKDDLDNLLVLYLHLHETSVPEQDDRLVGIWERICSDPDYHLIVAEVDGRLVSSCTCIVIPNLTRNVSPYALVENVVTDAAYRGQGYAGQCLAYAEEVARDAGCYKMMLITGSSDPKTHDFYRNAGFFSDGKTAYYKMLHKVTFRH